MSSSTSTTKSKIELSVHQVEPAIVVRLIGENRNENQLKIIQLKGINDSSNSFAISRFVQDQCQNLIPIEKLTELEQLISCIILRGRSTEIKASSSVDIEKLDDYLELLYEEGESKYKGVSLILQLVMEIPSSLLNKIVENEPLMGALVRIMKEDSRRNFDLAIQVGQLFYRLSMFIPFLNVLSCWKIGLLCLQLVEQELKRSEIWRLKLKELTDINSRRNWESALNKQDELITVCLQILLNMSEDLKLENKMQRKGLILLLFNAIEHSTCSKLVFIVIQFLWKLSQFVENQRYIMNNSSIIERLISFIPSILNNNSNNQLILKEQDEYSKEFIFYGLFSLLFNCSFELSNRRRMVQSGLVSLLSPYIYDYNIALTLMYQLSMEEDAKAMIAFTDCISILTNLLFNHKENEENKLKLIKSLLINIVLEKRNAQLFCGNNGKGLNDLFNLIFEIEKCGDVLSIKIARNIATHEGPTREMFGKWMPQIIENFIKNIKSNNLNNKKQLFAFECLGICVLITEIDWFEFDQNFKIINFLVNLLNNDQIEDNLILQTIMFSTTLASHNLQMAEKIENNILPCIINIINKRQDDDEIILQCLFLIYCLFSYNGNIIKRLCIEEESSLIGLILNFLNNKNLKISSLCEKNIRKSNGNKSILEKSNK